MVNDRNKSGAITPLDIRLGSLLRLDGNQQNRLQEVNNGI